MKCDQILFPIEFSYLIRALTSQVEWLATRFGSRVTLLHVFGSTHQLLRSQCGFTELFVGWSCP